MFETLLQAELASLPRRPELVIERFPDAVDNAVAAVNREMAEDESHRASLKQAAIEAALAKIRRSEYGICESCGCRISEARLLAIPWTPLCRTCAETEEVAR